VIPYGRQSLDQDDIEAVVAVLKSDFLTQGPAVPRFEAALAAYCGVPHALAMNSATSALHAACFALGVGAGDLVWTSPVTFVASANCALYCGAEVDFVDIDPATWNMSAAALEAKLVKAEAAGRLPKVVIPVHLCGQSCDMKAIHALATRYGFAIIEDASHAIGASYRGEPVGNCRYSDIAVFSFHPVKIVTSGEGGAALTRDPALATRMELFRSHGVTRDPGLMEGEPHGPWYYEQIALGYNYRITDIHAALGASQLAKVDRFVERRHAILERYNAALADLPLVLPHQHEDTRSSLHLYVIRIPVAGDPGRHRRVFEALRAAGIGVNLHYMPVYLQPYYRHLGFEPGLCPEAERYYAEAISLPMFPDLDDARLEQVIAAVRCVVLEETDRPA
jgi:UDP-4-amino-4,6-dideoxy-N-acetyl-beta-L-altrosamine transaminase